MTPDPYPDLAGAERTDARAQLSDADSRLLDALTRPAAHVVTAVEDDLLEVGSGQEDAGPVSPSARRGPVTPVFQEPTG